MRFRIGLAGAVLVLLAGCGGSGNADGEAGPTGEAGGARGTQAEPMAFERFDNGMLALEYPRGWQVFWAGQGTTLAFVARDPREPARQVFYFASVGPVYMSLRQKSIDQNYVRMGGHPVAWLEMPVVDPLTPQNFVAAWPGIAATSVARSFMPQVPTLDQIAVVHAERTRNPLGMGERGIVRAVFRAGAKAGEGLFAATVAPYMQFMNGPGGGNAYGFMITGITAPQDEFDALHGDLAHVLESFTISQQYAQAYIAAQQGVWAGVVQAGKTLSETSDLIMESWEQRNRTQDIMAEKRSDAILERERLYDPDTGEVYEFKNGFYDGYQLNPEQYRITNLQPLPDDRHDLWTKAAQDGAQAL